MSDDELKKMNGSMHQSFKMLMWFLGILVTINVSAIVWTGNKIINHEIRITTIESNRFTSKDASDLKGSIMDNLPPVWLIRDVANNTSEIKELKRMSVRPNG